MPKVEESVEVPRNCEIRSVWLKKKKISVKNEWKKFLCRWDGKAIEIWENENIAIVFKAVNLIAETVESCEVEIVFSKNNSEKSKH